MTKRWICGPCVFRVKGEPAKTTGDVFEYDFRDPDCEAAAIRSGAVRLHPDQTGMPQPPPPEDEFADAITADGGPSPDGMSTPVVDPAAMAPSAALAEITEPARRSRGRMRSGEGRT